jgi:hypothetical protein
MASPRTGKAIEISWNITVPEGHVASNPTSSALSIPVESASSLPEALIQARNEMNVILSKWKDEIGESEKPLEAQVVKEAEARKQEIKKAKARNGLEDEEDEEDEEEDE